MQKTPAQVLIVGAGLAGSEAAWFLAQKGVRVRLVESKTLHLGPAQKQKNFAELVCTNSLKSLDPTSAHGILKHEMRAMGSLVLEVASECQVPADQALAVDRERFGELVTQRLKSHPLIEVEDKIIEDPQLERQAGGHQFVIIACGPLPHPKLESWLKNNFLKDDYYFYDAIAPVVDADSLDTSKMYFKGRHGEGGDYLNVPFNKEEYLKLIEAMVGAQKVAPKNFEEEKFFEACLPIDLMAQRGVETARFSCMKPMGLETPDGHRPYAVLQLRKENLLGSAYNLVGFQTRMTYGEQARVLKMIPGFEQASFLHFGSVHRNSFLYAKSQLNFDLSAKSDSTIYFAGQVTGVEGYTESSSMGLYVAWQILRRLKAMPAVSLPVECAMGALVHYLMTAQRPTPSSINIGLFPEVALTHEMRKSKGKKKAKRELVAQRAKEIFDQFWQNHQEQERPMTIGQSELTAGVQA